MKKRCDCEEFQPDIEDSIKEGQIIIGHNISKIIEAELFGNAKGREPNHLRMPWTK